MERQYIDCREFPSDSHCSIAIVADTERELVAAAAQHAVAVHGHEDSPDLRRMLASCIKRGTPPEAPPVQRTPESAAASG